MINEEEEEDLEDESFPHGKIYLRNSLKYNEEEVYSEITLKILFLFIKIIGSKSVVEFFI